MSPSLWNAFKAFSQLGAQPILLNALYRFGLATGHYRRVGQSELRRQTTPALSLRPLFAFPGTVELLAVLGDTGRTSLLAEADEIVAGQVRLFGAGPVQLELNLPGKLQHWTAYETGRAGFHQWTLDIKMLWEPARFGWVFCLGRAFHLTGAEKYAAAFWQNYEAFAAANPPYLGPNWSSGQEVALRLMAFTWGAQVFNAAASSTPERKAHLAQAVGLHASRIVPTLPYARSQQNNHLLSEAAGLLTAGLALPDHPKALHWSTLGWKWINEGLRSQIDSYGEYAQHSTNYHRLMLELVLWTNALMAKNEFPWQPAGEGHPRWPRQTHEALVRSVHWLLSILDADSGSVPNLGANDGAYILPLASCPFSDHRPVLNAAARAFLDYDLPRGPWDELALWLGIPLESRRYVPLARYLGDQVYGREAWAYLRTAQFTSRPSHADQLHVDLWWHGLNVAQDAGTYRYSGDPIWENALTTALVHNTVTVNGRDQFTRAGRFLYLDWFNAYRHATIETDTAILQRVRGRHRGYWKQGIRHDRTVTSYADGHWQVLDELQPLRLPWDKKPRTLRLHWLLPDWDWQVQSRAGGLVLRLNSPYGPVGLTIGLTGGEIACMDLVRAGEELFESGPGDCNRSLNGSLRGWVSPTYAVKVPALSLVVETRSANDVQFISEFSFPK